MRVNLKHWLIRHQIFAIYCSFLLLSFLSLFIVYFRQGHLLVGDDYHFHLNRIAGLAESIKHGIYFPKVNYFFIGGYGYACSLFYPDLYLYFPAILRVCGISLAASFITFAIVINFCTFVITYISGRYMAFSVKKSYLFSLLYTLSIYRLQDLINRQAIGEVLALGFFPLVLASLFAIKNNKRFGWFFLALAMTGIGLAHFISIEMISFFIALYILFQPRQFLKKAQLFSLVKAAILTVLLLNFYLVPILEQMSHTIFKVTAAPLTLISNRSYPLYTLIGNSFINQVFHSQTANIGCPLIVGFFVYLIFIFKKNQNHSLILLTAFLIFMVSDWFPWKWFDNTPLNTIQFPWRLLSVVSLLIAYLIVEDRLAIFKKSASSYYILIFLVFFTVIFYEQYSIGTEQYRLISYEQYDQTHSYFIGAGREYLPKEVNYETIKKTRNRPIIYDSKMISIKKVDKNFSSIKLKYKLQKKNSKTTVTLPFIYYWGYQAKITTPTGTQKQPVTMNKSNGLTQVELKDQGTATIYYESTSLQKISLGITIITVISCLSYGIYFKVHNNEKINY